MRGSSSYTREFGTTIASIISDLPVLQTVVFVSLADTSAQNDRQSLQPPELSCLPSIDSPTFSSTHLKDLRIVQWSSPDPSSLWGHEGAESERPRRLDFSHMLQELESSAYCYLENLLIQLMPGVYVEEADVERLREYFTRVLVEHVEEPPKMPLPQCCDEDDDGPGGRRTWTRTLC